MLNRRLLKNYIDGSWCEADAAESRPVANPATAEILAQTPLSSADEVARAASAAYAALADWRRVPAGNRIQHLFRLKELLEESFFGTLHGQGRHAVEFFTQTKVMVERWPRQWPRRF